MVSPNSAQRPEGPGGAKRKLSAILSADVKGFSRLMGQDELGTHRTLAAHRRIMDELIAGHGGRVVGTAGDSVLADFPSVVDALSCAAEIQRALHAENSALPPDRRLEFRIGINLGDVIVDGDDIYGDGVNIAARLQAIGEPGGICISGGVYDQVKNKLDLRYRPGGTQRVKNIAEPVRFYAVEPGGGAIRAPPARNVRWWAVVASVVLLMAAGETALWVTAFRQADPDASTRGAETPAIELSVRPAVAVLPFADPGGDPEQEYFSDGITEDIISALGRFSNLRVMSWNAVLPYRGQAVTPEQLRRDLRVRYVVSGSIRRAGDRLRVTVQLTDAERGALLWSERYDQAVSDIFAVQDDITHRVVSTLAIKMTSLEAERAIGKPTDDLGAYDYVLRGRQHWRQFERSANVQAQELFEQAIELDPNYADAYAALGWAYSKAAELGWTEWPAAALQQAHELAQQAIRLDPSNASAHTLLGLIAVYQGRHELALREIDRAIELNPNHAESHAERGWVLIVSGLSEDAIRSLEDVLRFDPNPKPNTFHSLALAYYLQGRYDDAIVTLERAVGRDAHHIPSHIVLAAAYAQADRLQDAARQAAELRRLHPFFEIASYGLFFRNPADREGVAEGLRKAGLE